MNSKLFLRIVAIIPVSFLITACSGGPAAQPKLVQVSGKVLNSGKPLEGVTVQFVSEKPGGETASGRTDAEGKYTLFSQFGQGTAPGVYRVTISRMVDQHGKVLAEGVSPFSGGVKETMPEIYTDAGRTPVVSNVPADQESATIDIQIRARLSR